MSWWKDYIKQQMEIGRELGKKKRKEHEEKFKKFFKRRKKNEE